MSLRANALLLVLLSGILAILGEWNRAVPAHLWALPLGLLLLGLALEAQALRRSTVGLALRAPVHWPLAQPRAVTFEFSQQGARSLTLQTTLTTPAEFTASARVESLTLKGEITSAVTLEATPRRLGRYDWPAPMLRVGGWLQLAWWSRTLEAQLATTVIPDLTQGFELRQAEHAGGALRSITRGAGAEILQLRDYRPGDPLRVIDWKASARRNRLISREPAEDQSLELVIAVDAGRASGLGAGGVDRLGLYATVAARLAQRATLFDDAIGLMVFSAQPLAVLAPTRGAAALARLTTLLAASKVQASESNPVVAAARIRSMVQRRSLIVLLTDLEDAAAGEQLARAVRLLIPKHLPFIASVESERITALPRARVHDALGAYRALAASEYVDALQGNIRALRTLGAAAVTAPAATLDRAVIAAYQQFREQRRV